MKAKEEQRLGLLTGCNGPPDYTAAFPDRAKTRDPSERRPLSHDPSTVGARNPALSTWEPGDPAKRNPERHLGAAGGSSSTGVLLGPTWGGQRNTYNLDTRMKPDVVPHRALPRQKPPASSATDRNPARQSQIWARGLGFCCALFYLCVLCKAPIPTPDRASVPDVLRRRFQTRIGSVLNRSCIGSLLWPFRNPKLCL